MHNQGGGPTIISDETCLQQIEKHNTKEWHHRSLRKEIHCYHEIRWSLRWGAYQFRAQVWAHILIIILGDPSEFPQKSNFLRRTCNDHLVSSPHTILPLVHFNLSKNLNNIIHKPWTMETYEGATAQPSSYFYWNQILSKFESAKCKQLQLHAGTCSCLAAPLRWLIMEENVNAREESIKSFLMTFPTFYPTRLSISMFINNHTWHESALYLHIPSQTKHCGALEVNANKFEQVWWLDLPPSGALICLNPYKQFRWKGY